MAKFYGRLLLMRSVLRVLNVQCLTFIEIVILWVYLSSPFSSTLFLALFGITSHILNYFAWLKITDDGSISEMRIWSIFKVQSDLK